MTIDDQIGSDGVLRALISEQIDNKTYPVYPKTHADVVAYEDTTVRFKLDAFTAVLTNMQSALQDAVKSIDNLKVTTYDKEYITGALSEITSNISTNASRLIQLQQAYDALSYYTQPEIDQKLYNLNQDFSRTLSSTITTVSELSSYVNATFGTSTDIAESVARLTKAMTEADDAVKQMMADDFRQISVDIHAQVADQMSNYAKRSSVDEQVSSLQDNITSISDNLSTFRGDVVIMNTQSENNVNEHMDAMKYDLLNNHNIKLSNMRNDFNNRLDKQNISVNAKFSQAIATIGSLGGLVTSKLEQIISVLGSMGGTISPGVYESADEEAY